MVGSASGTVVAVAQRNLERFDPLSPQNVENPYPYYAALRTEAPLYRPPGLGWHYVSRYADIKAITLDTQTFSSNIVGVLVTGGSARLANFVNPDLPFLPADVLAIADPPRHRGQRRLTMSGMGRDVLSEVSVFVADQVQRRVDSFCAAQRGDFMAQVAFELPMRVALRLLGLPQTDCARVKRWSDDAIALLSGINTRLGMAKNVASSLVFWRWCRKRVARAHHGQPTGLIAALLQGVDAGTLTEREASSIVMQILIAGSDSSASLMGSAVRLLAADTTMQSRLRQHPELIPSFIEETLRLEAPFQGHFRRANAATEIAGRPIAAGDRLFLLWASGNRDERQFPAAETVDLERTNPRAHFSFGHGIHLCIGAALGRMEACAVVSALLERTRAFTLADGAVRHRPSIFVRTLERLELQQMT